jgi:hypothetical protein
MLVGMAGREATLTVIARDRYNNPATFDGQRLRVDAVGRVWGLGFRARERRGHGLGAPPTPYLFHHILTASRFAHTLYHCTSTRTYSPHPPPWLGQSFPSELDEWTRAHPPHRPPALTLQPGPAELNPKS